MGEFNVEEMKGEFVKLVGDLQKNVDDKDVVTQDKVDKMADAASKITEDIQAIEARQAAADEAYKESEKSRAEFELLMAKRNQKSATGDELFSDPEFKTQFSGRLRRKLACIDEEAVKAEADRAVEFYSPNASEEGKLLLRKDLSIGSQPGAGYMVPIDSIRGISKREFETTPMARLATVITTTRNSVPWLIDDEEIETNERCEVGPAVEALAPGLALKEIFTHELTTYPKVTEQLLEDETFGVETWLEGKIADGLSRKKNTWYTVGNGTNQAEGFLSLDAWTSAAVYERGKLGAITTASAGVFDYDDFVDIQATLVDKYHNNAKFLMNRLAWAEVLKLKDSEDRPLLNPQAFFQGAPMQVLGDEVILASDLPMPTAGTFATNAKAVAYGDFRAGYLIANRIGIKILRDELTSKGFVKYWVRTRSGGAVVDYQAIKYMVIQ